MNIITLVQYASVFGFIISLYFTAVYRGWVKGDASLVPKNICKKNVCVDVLHTPFAALFKVPNFYIGLIYYVVIFLSTLDFYYLLIPGVIDSLLIVSLFVAIISVYLAYILIFRLKMNCVLCFIAHLINLFIFYHFLSFMFF